MGNSGGEFHSRRDALLNLRHISLRLPFLRRLVYEISWILPEYAKEADCTIRSEHSEDVLPAAHSFKKDQGNTVKPEVE